MIRASFLNIASSPRAARLAALHEPDWGKAMRSAARSTPRNFPRRRRHFRPVLIIGDLIDAAGGLSDIVLHAAHARATKDELRANVDAAQSLGLYGAPSFTVGNELFWGDDRLEDALDWAVNTD